MDDLRDELDAANDLAAGLQERVDELENDLTTSEEDLEASQSLVSDLQSVDEAPRAAAGDAELQGLASTVRECQRTGHPDLATHLDNLLTALGA